MGPSEVNMTPKRMLTGALLLVVSQPSLSSPYVLIRQASPLLYPASYPSGSHQTLYNGMYSPWTSFYYPIVVTQRNTTPAATRELVTTAYGCGTWISTRVGQSGCYKHFKELKSWQEAREQCREEGRSQGVSDADLAYFDTATERDEVMEVLDIGPTSVHSIWLNGKLEGNGFVVTKDSKWDIVIGISDIADTEWIGGSAPIFDSNAERNLYIRPQDKKLGADPGDFTSKEFICKFEKLVCKDSTWIHDIDNQRCLRFPPRKKTYENAKDDCENMARKSTLESLVPSVGTKLEELTKFHLGTWVLESASKDATGTVKFTTPSRGDGPQGVPVKESLAHWTIDPSYELTTDSRNLFLNRAGRLAPAFGTPKAGFICQHTPLEFDDPTITSPPQSQVVLITGGANGGELKSAEIFNPVTKTSCSLPEIPVARWHHSQDGGLACGGRSDNTRKTCVKWSPASGTWTQSHTLSQKRRDHVSWATASGVYLIGGGSSPRTSEKVKLDGSVEEGFSLKYNTAGACSIPDPDNEEVIITGGDTALKTVSVYSGAGWQRDLASLNQGRNYHACGSYRNGGKKFLMVTGGYGSSYLDSTEIFSDNVSSDNVWRTVAARLPVAMRSPMVASISNRVLLFGGYGGGLRKEIVEFNQETESWTVIGEMKEGKFSTAVSVVSFDDYKKWCN